MSDGKTGHGEEAQVRIPAGGAILEGDLAWPDPAGGLVVFAHGSGSSRHSPRNRAVAQFLRQAGLGTLLFDLLTAAEEREDLRTAGYRFDIPFLAERLVAVTDWLPAAPQVKGLAVGYFGASTGAAAALAAAAARPAVVKAVVSRGGRPDLAGKALAKVRAPTLLIVGGFDHPVIAMNQEALEKLPSEKELVIVPGATHLFEERGTLEEVARLAAGWFRKYLAGK
ncbi:MAG: dienelactone hydrolase family protein [Deltaproteobacteria bacterium]|nr:dienelactone hydrolase family protein [Deltaproteobacteria bacterium]